MRAFEKVKFVVDVDDLVGVEMDEATITAFGHGFSTDALVIQMESPKSNEGGLPIKIGVPGCAINRKTYLTAFCDFWGPSYPHHISGRLRPLGRPTRGSDRHPKMRGPATDIGRVPGTPAD